MDAETRLEIKGRTIKLDAYEQEKERLNSLQVRLVALYVQTHVTVKGVRQKLTKRKRIAMANKLIDAALSESITIDSDAINQVKILDA